jgi:hypothetical protein
MGDGFDMLRGHYPQRVLSEGSLLSVTQRVLARR